MHADVHDLDTPHRGDYIFLPSISTIAIEIEHEPQYRVQRRTLVKTTTYRLMSIAVTAAAAWFLTREIASAAAIGTLDTVFKFGFYYLHERVWDRFDFGRAQPPHVSVLTLPRRKENVAKDTGSRRRSLAGRRA